MPTKVVHSWRIEKLFQKQVQATVMFIGNYQLVQTIILNWVHFDAELYPQEILRLKSFPKNLRRGRKNSPSNSNLRSLLFDWICRVALQTENIINRCCHRLSPLTPWSLLLAQCELPMWMEPLERPLTNRV